MSAPGVCLNIIKERQESDGVGTLNNPKKFHNQDYALLREYYVVRKRRYIDDMFPPDNNSIGENLLKKLDLAKVEWIRPTKLVSNPHLIVDGVSRFDFAQGKVGNCWFLAAVGALTFQKHIMEKIIPLDQSFQKHYVGIFHFRFWRFGKWVDVVIDDKLPTFNGRLIFVHPQSPRTPQSPTVPEFWPALLEKAYAKVCGSYEDMNYGWVSEALKDFTGGVQMTIVPQNEKPQDLWDMIYRAATAKSLMGCGTPGNAKFNAKQDSGLVEGHAYTVTGVTKVTSNGNQIQLIRLFNPWGDTEWKGDWSDGSKTWTTISEEEQKQFANFAEDGEFWMSVEDFCKCFCQLDICNLSPAFLEGSLESHWILSVHDNRWLAGSTAGGSMEYKDTFWKNPQFPVRVSEVNKACEPVPNKGPNVFVSLMQKPDKRNRCLTRNLHLGFSIFKRSPEMKDSREAHTSSLVYSTKNMFAAREITEYVRLDPGNYIIVPYTYETDKTASFILSLFSKTETHTGEPLMEVGSDGKMLRQISDHYQELNAEQLQRLLNENYTGVPDGAQSKGGFSLDICQSIVAMMDISVTGTLNALEFSELKKKLDLYKDVFYHVDSNRDGILSLMELRNAVEATGFRVGDKFLELTTLRFADSTGRITLERFIYLALRLSCMSEIFKKLADRQYMHLKEHEWLHLTMYS